MGRQTQQIGILNNPSDFPVGLKRTLDGGKEMEAVAIVQARNDDAGKETNGKREKTGLL